MVPSLKQLSSLSKGFRKIIDDTSTLKSEEFKIIFKTDADSLQKINEDFFYHSSNREKNEKINNNVNKIEVKINGINFIYENRE